jgi:hypothetical protein
MMPLFTRPDAWTGGSYELALEYGRMSPDALARVVAHLWSHPTLEGCYLDHSREPTGQRRVSPAEVDPGLCLRGLATLPNGDVTTCLSSVVAEPEATWVYFGSPMGALGHSYPVGAYPFDDGLPLDWRNPLDGWLLDMASFAFAVHPFRLGLVGWVDPLNTSAAEVASSGAPDPRWEGYIVPSGGALEWYPPNAGAPITLS